MCLMSVGKNEIQLFDHCFSEADAKTWNEFLEKLDVDKRTYFTTKWLYAECYMYRRLKSIFEQT